MYDHFHIECCQRLSILQQFQGSPSQPYSLVVSSKASLCRIPITCHFVPIKYIIGCYSHWYSYIKRMTFQNLGMLIQLLFWSFLLLYWRHWYASATSWTQHSSFFLSCAANKLFGDTRTWLLLFNKSWYKLITWKNLWSYLSLVGISILSITSIIFLGCLPKQSLASKLAASIFGFCCM